MDQRLPELVAVITPARTDIVGVRQSGDTRDKKETIAQALSLIIAADIATPLKSIAAGSAAAPSLAWGDGDTGFYELADGIINFTSQGVGVWSFRTGAILPFNAAGPAMLNEAATSINPTFAPNAADLNSGLGWNAEDQLSLIAGGVEIARAIEAGAGNNQFAIAQSGASDVPELTSIADLDTGFNWTGSNQIDVITAGSISWSLSSAKFFSSLSDGPCIANVAANNAVAIFRPDQSDVDTGFAYHGNDAASITVGGIAGLILKELNSGVVQAPVADVAITAFATGGQGSAVALKQSYNVISVCATAGDSVKLPATFNVNSIVYIKNDGAESADVFPASGDDLGAGADTAVAVAAGESVTFIATVANATWTQLIRPAAGAPADPLLLGDGTKTNPTYSFSDDPDTGMYTSFDGVLAFSAAGVEAWKMTGDLIAGFVGNGPQMRNRAATAVIPTLIPHTGDPTTGIGAEAAKPTNLSLIASGVEGIRIKNEAGIDSIVIHPGFIPNDPVTPSLAFGDGDTGFYENADDFLSVAIAGVRRFVFGGNNTGFGGVLTGAGRIMDELASATNPTIVPFNTDLDTGLGHNAEDQLSIIAGGVEIAQAKELVGGNQFIVAPGAFQSNANLPSLAFGDGDTGFFETTDDNFRLSVAGAARVGWSSTGYFSNTGGGFQLLYAAPSATVPSLLPNGSDLNTGIGRANTDQLSLIAGGVEGMRISESGGISQIEIGQGTNDAPFFDFQATADADATSAISTLTTSGATTHHVQIEINGVTAWIAVSTTDPS